MLGEFEYLLLSATARLGENASGAATTDAAFAEAITSGHADQNGAWTSPYLPPGKYFVIATHDTPDRSPETIAKISRSRIRAQEIEINPGAPLPVSLASQPIE
jgi:hypothetical protein